jgi:hypothetical protein
MRLSLITVVGTQAPPADYILPQMEEQMIWFRKARKLEGDHYVNGLEPVCDLPYTNGPCEPVIERDAIVYPTHDEVCALTKSLQEFFNAYTCIFIEIKKHPQYQEAILKYYLYVGDKCSDYFDSFEELKMFAASLVGHHG